MLNKIKGYFFTGLLALVPLLLTFAVFWYLIKIIDDFFRNFFPEGYQLPFFGFGILSLLIIILITGFLTSNFLGNKIVHYYDRLLQKLPLIGSVYSSVKQVLGTFTKPQGQSFSSAVLVESPNSGQWSFGFIINNLSGKIESAVKKHKKLNKDLVVVFIPFVPLPTAGLLLLVAREDVIELDLKIPDALQYVISLGMADKSEQPLMVSPKLAAIKKSKK